MFKEFFENVVQGKKCEKQWEQREVFMSAMEQLQHVCGMVFYGGLREQGVNVSYKEYQIDVIEYFMSLIRKELSACGRAEFLLANEEKKKRIFFRIFPSYYCNEAGECELCTEREELIRKELNEETYIVPWSRERVVENFFCLQNKEWKLDRYNHRAWYYEELGLLHMYNGLHSSSTFVNLEKEGEVLAYHVILKDVFPYLKTDGAFWEHVLTGKKEEVKDVRFAILYEFARKKEELLKTDE